MRYRHRPRRTTPRIPRFFIASLLVVLAALAVVIDYRLPASWPWAGASPIEALRNEYHVALGESDDATSDATTILDDSAPSVVNLDPPLLAALRRAQADAAVDGVTFLVNSGWRSPEEQNQLLREAVARYGSQEEAARWVATADTSPHVSGDAVDIGLAGTAWLAKHGAGYGLCQIYRNEPWHYELRPEAITHGCPAMYADPTQDPRMQE